VSENVPSVTVLVAARPEEANVKAVAASRAMDYPADRIEVLVARGKQPSAQRNAGMKSAAGELIYFLDDDSLAQVENLRRATAHFQDPKVQMVGGPNICPPEAPILEQVFARVLASRVAFGPSRARYTPVGRVRETSEKELILCNLLARRETLLALGGFNEALYPNEENALMDELQKRGGKLIYDPDFFVYRRPRSTLKSFAKMLMTYGRGRAEQFRLHPTFGSALNFVPPLFLLYLVMLVFVVFVAMPWNTKVLLEPLAIYVLLVLGAVTLGVFHQSARAPGDKTSGSHLGFGKRLLVGTATAPLIVLTHLLYGFGFWRGLFTKLGPAHKSSSPIAIERVGT
jgi:cellulose synthase/poly-beta-1,6-N-acetylglucosamine synthase-like glycosyltransferase